MDSLNGRMYDGRELRVQMAKHNARRPPGAHEAFKSGKCNKLQLDRRVRGLEDAYKELTETPIAAGLVNKF